MPEAAVEVEVEVEPIGEAEPESELNLAKRRLLRRAAEHRIAAPPPASTTEVESESALVPVEPLVIAEPDPTVEIEVAAEPLVKPPAPASSQPASRWNRLLGDSTEIDTEASAGPVDVETIAEPQTVEPTPKRIKGRRRIRAERQIESPKSTNIETATDLESQPVAPTVDNIAEPIAEVEVEIATVIETEPELEPNAEASLEPASRWNRLLSDAPEIDTEPSAGPVDVETIAEPQTVEPTPKRIKGRRRHSTTTEPQFESPRSTSIETATDVDSQPVAPTVAPTVDNIAEPIAEVEVRLEVEVATVVETETESEPIAPASLEPASRWNRLLGDASEIDAELSAGPVDVETIAELQSVEPTPKRIRGRRRARAERQIDAVTEPETPSIDDAAESIAGDEAGLGLGVDVAPVAEVETASEPVAPALPEGVGPWNQLLAASSPNDTEPFAGPVDVETIAEPETAEPVAEVEIEVATVIETETESEPIASPSPEGLSRWDQLLAAGSSQIDGAPSAPVDVEAIAEPAPQQTPDRIKRRRRRIRAARQIDATTEAETAEPIAAVEVEDITGTETESESAATATDVPAEQVAEVEVEAVGTPAVEHRRNRTRRRPRRMKTDRDDVAAPAATLEPSPAEVITSTEPESTPAGSLADIAIEPISELVTVLPVVDASVVETAFETAVFEAPVEDAPTIDPVSGEPAGDVNSERTANKTSRWGRRSVDGSHDIVPPAAIAEVDIEVECTSVPDTQRVEVETDDVAEIETSVDEPTPSTPEPVEPSPLVDLAPESSAAHDPNATAEPVTEARRETTPNATQGRWDRLIAETAVRSTPAPVSEPAPNTVKGRGRRRERAERQIDAGVAPVVTDVGPATADLVVEVTTAPIAESESRSTASPPNGRWDRLVSESVARTAAAPSAAPLPKKKSTKRQRRSKKASRRVELPTWVAPLESEVKDEPIADVEVATASLPTTELQPAEPLPFVGGAAELIAEVDLEPSPVDLVVEATIETRAENEPAPTEGRWDRLRADARGRADLSSPPEPAVVEVVDAEIETVTESAPAEAPSTSSSRRRRRRAEQARQIETSVAEAAAESSVERAQLPAPPAPVVHFAAVPLEPTFVDIGTDFAGDPARESALLEVETGVASAPETEPATPIASVDPVSEGVLEASWDAAENRWSRLVEEASVDRSATSPAPVSAEAEPAERSPQTSPSPAKSRRLRRAKPHDRDRSATPSPDAAPVVAAEVPIDVTAASPTDVATEAIVPDPTWNETEDYWRRLIAEAASSQTLVSSGADVEVNKIVPAPTPTETTGRWRRLVAEAQSSDDEPARADVAVVASVEPVLTPAIVDLTTEAHSRVIEVGPAASQEIERLPRVGGDMRVMIDTLRRKAHKDLDEDEAATAAQSDTLPVRSPRSG
ncbi:MAG: hypothetical protein ACLPVY_20405 [Acidimicrobiia bacterium]